MSTIGGKVSHAAGTAAEFVFNPATAAQVVGRDAIAMIIDRALAVNASDSLVSATQAARVEPLCLVDTDALFIDELSDVLQSMNSIFAGYYLQAIQLESTVGNVKVLETLEKFNPNRGRGRDSLIGSAHNLVMGGIATGQHAIAVKAAGHGLGHGNLTSAAAGFGGIAMGVQHMFATESYLDALPDYSLIDDIALEATAPQGKTKRQVKVDAPAFVDDKSYKNWKQHRELAQAGHADRQQRERINDRRKQQDTERERNVQQREDRDHMLGQRQQQANDRQAQQDRQKDQDARQKVLDAERADDRKQSKKDKEDQAKRQQVLDNERKADREANAKRQSESDARQAKQDAERDADRMTAAQKAEREAADHDAELARVSTSFGSDSLKEIKEASNLSVGKMLDIEIKHNGQVFQVPVAVRLVVNTIPSAQLVHILSLSNEITSAKERFHAWKAGRLEFVKDLLFCRDLIDEHRRNLMKDSDSVFANVVKRENRSIAAAILSGVPSVASASNMIVTTQNTIEEVELTMTGKFSDFHARQAVFEKTSLMIVAVIDKEWNRVTFYHRGLPDATEVSYRDLKTASKNGGPDVSDILKAYTLGNAPRL